MPRLHDLKCELRQHDQDQDHFYGERRTSRVGFAPEHHPPTLIFRVTQDIMKLNGEAVQMPDMQRTKVMVEGIVK